MLYQELVQVYAALAATPKRLEKTHLLATFIKKLNNQDMNHVLLLLQGLVFPLWDERKLGIADKLVLRAIHLATGTPTENIEQLWKQHGDLGDATAVCVASKSQITLFSNPLTLEKVFTNLQHLATFTGEGTVDKKIALVSELLANATPEQSKYIIRTTLEDLRIGLGEGTLRDSIVWACFDTIIGITYDSAHNDLVITPEQRKTYNTFLDLVQSAYDRTTDLAAVLSAARAGEETLKKITIKPGNPLNVMLYQKAKNISEALATVGTPASAEYKYDGFRIQIHKTNNTIKLFTRKLEDVTPQFPDIIQTLHATPPVDFIIEAEVVGYDPAQQKYLPFQNISIRIQRKHNIEQTAQHYPVHTILFDLLYLDGRDCTSLPYKDRIDLLTTFWKQTPTVYLATRIISSQEQEVFTFYQQSLAQGNEGIMLKNLSSPYQPGSRVGFGVKVKAVMDAFDAVIVGAEWGEGKRSAWLASFVIACIHNNEYLTIGRVGTGFKEKAEEGTTFAQLTELLKEHIQEQKGKDVIIKPAIVIEVNYEEIQQSPSYASGYALRFPRFIRLRPDKKPLDANTLADLKRLYAQQ